MRMLPEHEELSMERSDDSMTLRDCHLYFVLTERNMKRNNENLPDQGRKVSGH